MSQQPPLLPRGKHIPSSQISKTQSSSLSLRGEHALGLDESTDEKKRDSRDEVQETAASKKSEKKNEEAILGIGCSSGSQSLCDTLHPLETLGLQRPMASEIETKDREPGELAAGEKIEKKKEDVRVGSACSL